MPLKAWVAAVFLAVEAAFMAAVVYATSTHALRNDSQLLGAAQRTITASLEAAAVQALIAKEMAPLAALLDHLRQDQEVAALRVETLQGVVLAATEPSLIVQRPPLDTRNWRYHALHGDGRPIGRLAIAFSDQAQKRAQNETIVFAIGVVIIGTILNGFLALAASHLVDRYLSDIADTAEQIASGNSDARIVLPGHHEIARLGRAFNIVVDRLESNLQKLRDSRDRLIKPTEAMSEGFALWDSSDRLLLYNRQFCTLFSPIACSIRPGMSFAFFARLVNDCLRHGDSLTIDGMSSFADRHHDPDSLMEFQLHDGRWLSIYTFKTPDNEIICIYSDISERKERERALAWGQRRLQAIMNSVIDGILTVKADGRIAGCNRAATRIFDLPDNELVGCRLEDLVEGGSEEGALFSIKGLAILPPDRIVELAGHRRDGSSFPVELSVTELELQGEIAFIVTLRDVTSRKATEAIIRHQATHDALTQLPNRSCLDERLEDALEIARRQNERLAVLFLDLDRFKMVNDSLGHSVGDALLVSLGERLRSHVRDTDIIARMGGDEFIVVLPRITGSDDALGRAQRLLEAIRPPFRLQGHELHVTASIGISLFPDDGRSAEQLLKTADLALYRAKDAGRNRFMAFKPMMNASMHEQLHLESELRRALEKGEITVVYQPQIDLETLTFVGVEALARWHHAEMGPIGPEKFIPLAEETGLIHDLGLFVLRSACLEHRRWRDHGLSHIRLAVNMSASQLQAPKLLSDLETVIRETAMDIGRLELELTESMLMQSGEAAMLLHSLNDLGVSIALDDFGTGFSSLSYLRRLTIDRIKIDRSFIREIDTDSNDEALARAIVGMAHGLDVQVIAEGVETDAQFRLLRELGCKEAQGYYFGEPMAGDLVPVFARPWLAPRTEKVKSLVAANLPARQRLQID